MPRCLVKIEVPWLLFSVVSPGSRQILVLDCNLDIFFSFSPFTLFARAMMCDVGVG